MKIEMNYLCRLIMKIDSIAISNMVNIHYKCNCLSNRSFYFECYYYGLRLVRSVK